MSERRSRSCRRAEAALFSIDASDEKTAHVWHVYQLFAAEDGAHDFGLMGDVDLDATQDGGEVIFKNYRVGFIEDLLEVFFFYYRLLFIKLQ